MAPSPPLAYGILLYPGFEVLDVAGPIEFLNTLARRAEGSNLTLAVLGRALPDNPDVAQPITPANPAAVDGKPSPGFNFQSQQVYQPTHTLTNPPPLDVLLVPGGYGSLPPTLAQPEVDFLRRIYPSLQYLITVCTGAGLAAAAGILDGHCATTNKAVWADVTATGPRTYWVAHARWIVSGNIWTTSGVSAGTDGMVAFLAHVYDETHYPGLVQRLLNAIEYNRVRDSWHDPFANIWGAVDVPPQKGVYMKGSDDDSVK